MQINKIHHLDFLHNSLPDGCASLIISDPPYFRVKGDFDFIWKSFEQYLDAVRLWVIECNRLLAPNGTLFWCGNSKNIAYSQMILDEYMLLENSLVWRKIDSMQYQYYSADAARVFNTHNERLLMYSSKKYSDYDSPFANYLREQIENSGVNRKDLSKLFPSKTGKLTGCVSNWMNGFNVITREQYLTVRGHLGSGYMAKDYDTLLDEHNKHRRYFNNQSKLEEVLEFSQEGHITKNYDHDTKKPETLTRALILTCSRVGDLVVVPFSGSGTECAMSCTEDRNFVGFDICKEYVQMSNSRIENINQTLKLF